MGNETGDWLQRSERRQGDVLSLSHLLRLLAHLLFLQAWLVGSQGIPAAGMKRGVEGLEKICVVGWRRKQEEGCHRCSAPKMKVKLGFGEAEQEVKVGSQPACFPVQRSIARKEEDTSLKRKRCGCRESPE